MLRPNGTDPFAKSPRTPGTLGVNDAASPDSPGGLIGDTPGTLGVNDQAAAVADHARHAQKAHLRRTGQTRAQDNSELATFLNSVVDWNDLSLHGPPIVFNWAGHGDMSQEARADFSTSLADFLPPSKASIRGRLLDILGNLPREVQWTDITPTQFMKSGQALHFMAYKGQSQVDAYKASMKKIWEPVAKASELFHRQTDRLRSYDPYFPMESSRGEEFDLDLAASNSLGHGVHTLQDSFSAAHVTRQESGNRSMIAQLFVWADQDKKDHEKKDAKWGTKNEKTGKWELTALGKEVVDATKMLLAYFVLLAVDKNNDATNKAKQLADKYFMPTDGLMKSK